MEAKHAILAILAAILFLPSALGASTVSVSSPVPNQLITHDNVTIEFNPSSTNYTATECFVNLNASPAVTYNGTTLLMNATNEIELPLLVTNVSTVYEYNVTCTFNGVNVSGAQRTFRMYNPGTEPLPALVHTVVIAALAFVLMLCAFGMATSGTSMTVKAMSMLILLVIFAIVFQMIA